MFRFRFSIILTIAWLAFVLNFNEILESLAIHLHVQDFVLALCIGTVIVMMLVFKSHKIPSSVSIATLVLLYAIGKVLFRTNLDIETYTATVIIELGTLLFTFFVTRPVVEWLTGYNNKIKSAVFSSDNTLISNSYNNTAAIERKISLARRFGRELSLLYIPMSNKFEDFGEIKSLALKQEMGELIEVMVGHTGLYSWHHGDLMICLQGDAVNYVETIANQFSKVMADVLKTQVQVGIANFPHQGLILDDLIETATVVLRQPGNQSISASIIELFPNPVRTAQTVSA